MSFVDHALLLEDFVPTIENLPSEIQFLLNELSAKDTEFHCKSMISFGRDYWLTGYLVCSTERQYPPIGYEPSEAHQERTAIPAIERKR